MSFLGSWNPMNSLSPMLSLYYQIVAGHLMGGKACGDFFSPARRRPCGLGLFLLLVLSLFVLGVSSVRPQSGPPPPTIEESANTNETEEG